jgi:TonB family protein
MRCLHCLVLAAALSCSNIVLAQSHQSSTSGQNHPPSTASSGSQPQATQPQEPTRSDALTSDAFANACREKTPPQCTSPPRLIDAPSPSFTAWPEDKSGVCRLSVIVEPNGKTSNIRVVKSLTVGQDRLAMEAVKKWKFKPATKDGKPVAVEIAVEVTY